MNYIGMDIHKRFTYAVAKDDGGNILAEERFDNSEDNFQIFLKPFAAEQTKIVMESTGVWEYIYSILESLNYNVKLANPVKTKAIASAKVKTDAVDAATLADLLRANLIAESYIPPKEIRKLRELTRLRKITVKQKVQVENRLHALLTRRGICLPKKSLCKKSVKFLREHEQEPSIIEYLELIDFHREREKTVLKRVEEEAVTNKDALLLMSFPGIGAVRALEIVAEIGEINRFTTAEKLASYAGLVSSVHQSGSTLYFGRLMQHASRTLKHTFIQTAWTTIRTEEGAALREFYKKLEKKKGKQKAICATARKICCIVHAMLKNHEECRYS